MSGRSFCPTKSVGRVTNINSFEDKIHGKTNLLVKFLTYLAHNYILAYLCYPFISIVIVMTVLIYSTVWFLFQLFNRYTVCLSFNWLHGTALLDRVYNTYVYALWFRFHFAEYDVDFGARETFVQQFEVTTQLGQLRPVHQRSGAFRTKGAKRLEHLLHGCRCSPCNTHSAVYIHVTHHIYLWYCRAQWFRGGASDSRLREPGFETCAAVTKPWAVCINEYLAKDNGG